MYRMYILVSVAGIGALPLSFITPSFPTALHEDLQTIEYGALQKRTCPYWFMRLILVGAISVSRSYWHWSVCDVTKFTNYMHEKGLS